MADDDVLLREGLASLPWELMQRARDLFHCDYAEFDRTQPALRLFVVEQDLSETREFLDRDVQDPYFWASIDPTMPPTTPIAPGTSHT
ncbi:hypothetical protein E0H75_10715 [Kribbella capetownensis]|uniref:Uncharacterized protein n=1 Tax=Kribbella capetownensis TaxID=1572659 RepID=A0A4R0JTB3_9ACTN|nr:hypothetical protein [Kribbella capetownensis]TCC50661.1 hypothetical protein E0H75_10715 [Kribbella capetownensis]